jgi:4-hydroxybenzoate polyprenyltransferase
MAICRGLDVLLGAGGHVDRRTLRAAATVAAHTVTITALSHGEVDGLRPAIPAATLAATVAVAVTPRGRLGRLLAVLYLAIYGRAQIRAMTDTSAASVRSAVVNGITGLPLLQGALVAGEGAPRTGALVSLAAPAGWLLARRVSPT